MVVRSTLAVLALGFGSTAARAQDPGPYLDDRSTPQAVVLSLYNAVERREWARAWSYFRNEARAPFAEFAAGYETTRHVWVRLGSPSSEGAAGSIFYAVPAVVEATSGEGVAVFAGCYELRLVQPAAQIEPPFQAMGISKGTLTRVEASFETARGRCQTGDAS